MIRINLIPTKRRKKAKPIATYLVSTVFVVVGFIAITFFAHSFMTSKVEELERRSAKNKAEIARLDKEIKKVRDFERIRDEFKRKKGVIEELTANQSLPVRVLDNLSQRLSKGIWLTTMKISKKSVSIAGVGFNNNDIVDYVQNMKESTIFKDVVLLGTTKAMAGQVETFRFNINFKINPEGGDGT